MRQVNVLAALALALSLAACGSPGENNVDCDPSINPACPCSPACEATQFCRAGACVACAAHEATCGDGFDDDCDGLTDCADPDCAARQCEADDRGCTDDVCADGACTHPVSANGTTCSDGDSCSQNDTCQSGVCVPGTQIPCNTPPGECYEPQGVCDQAGCHYVPRQAGAACASDGNACTADACDGAGACTHAVQEGLVCDDGDACTAGTTCSAAGTCNGGTQVTCTTPPDADCYEAAGVCDPARGCVYAPVPANTPCASDGVQCTRDVCNASGQCTHPANTNATCDDGDACTTGERCNASAACTGGTGVVCPGAECKTAACNSATGCYQITAANGTACTSDGNECTLDACYGGVCQHPGGNDYQACASDNDACTTDRCLSGVCRHTVETCSGSCACPGGQACCGGRCTDLSSDWQNCGACGNNCDVLRGCDPNQCWVSDCNAGVCSACRDSTPNC